VTRSSSKQKRAVTNRLWRYRTAQQLSQKHVARLLGHRSSAQVSRWENGVKTPTLDNALMLGHILKAPVEALFADRAAELQAEVDARTARTNHAEDKTRKAS
jgi:transcriptional regulator with XRE-family HTH domain